uniref:Polyamine modulated factor 1 n=1 Tax=Aotus nancymaae TaxID=37293 RepID=A0A2K5DMZ7_AOTNA
MAEASSANLGRGCEEKRHEESSPESVPPGTTISRVKLLDTMVDTFLQKLVAAGSYQRFTDCYKRFYQLQPEMTQRIYDKFIAELQTSIWVSGRKEEGNVGYAPWHPTSCSNGTPCGATCRNRRLRTGSWQMPSWQGGGSWRSCSYRSRPGSRPGRLYTENRRSW